MKKAAPNLYEVLRTTMAAAPARRAPPRKVSPHPAPDAETEPVPSATQVAVEEPPEPVAEATPPPAFTDPPTAEESVEVDAPEDVPEPEPTPPVAEAEAAPPPEPEPVAQSFAPEPEPEPPAPEPEATLPEEPPEPAPAPTVAWAPPPEPAAEATAEPEARTRTPLGERRIHVSYNTLLFAGLVLLIAFFAAYSAGFQRGRAAAEPVDPAPIETSEATPAEPADTAPSDPEGAPLAPAPAAATLYRIGATCWATRNATERREASSNAQRFTQALREAGFPDVETLEGTSPGGAPALWVCIGLFPDRGGPDAEQWMERVRQFVFNQTRPFRNSASWLETAPPQ